MKIHHQTLQSFCLEKEMHDEIFLSENTKDCLFFTLNMSIGNIACNMSFWMRFLEQ